MTIRMVRAMASLERRAEEARTLKMLTFRNNLRALVKDERGVTAMEYGLIAALVAVVIIGSVTTLGTSLSATFKAVAAALPPG
ncbi:MAG: Flp family type IVb pilin [Acetobacteraceae bacterium]